MTTIAREPADRRRTLILSLIFAPLVLALGFLSGRAAQSGPDNPWFAALVKPSIYPPPWAFGVVWSILYVLMGIALAMVVASPPRRWRTLAIVAFVVQLAANLAWSPLFFGAQRIAGALALLLLIDALVIVTLVLFHRVRRRAALLLVPYLAWVLFATYLNSAFLTANPGA